MRTKLVIAHGMLLFAGTGLSFRFDQSNTNELKKELREQGLSREEVEQRLRERKLTHEEMEPLRRSFDYAAHWLTEDYVPAATDAERNCGASRAGWAYPVLIGAAVDIRR